MYRFRERFKDMVKMGKERKLRMDDLSELTGISYIFLIQISPAIVSIPVGKMLCDKIKKDSKGMRILMSALTVAVIFIVKLILILKLVQKLQIEK